jgi:hypothetical protein
MPFGKSKDYAASPNAITNYVVLDEPPDADPHVRWCERGRLAAAPYSIRSRDNARAPICENTLKYIDKVLTKYEHYAIIGP